MKFSCPYPDNLNPLSPNGYQLIIDKLPNITFFSQTLNLPGVSMMGEATYATPFSDIQVPSEKLQFDDLQCTFLVDEKLLNYRGIYSWMIGLGFPEANSDYIDFINKDANTNKSELEKMYSPARMIIFGNNLTPIQTVEFIDLYPLNLSELQFTNVSNDVDYLTATATFNYTYYRFD